MAINLLSKGSDNSAPNLQEHLSTMHKSIEGSGGTPHLVVATLNRRGIGFAPKGDYAILDRTKISEDGEETERHHEGLYIRSERLFGVDTWSGPLERVERMHVEKRPDILQDDQGLGGLRKVGNLVLEVKNHEGKEEKYVVHDVDYELAQKLANMWRAKITRRH